MVRLGVGETLQLQLLPQTLVTSLTQMPSQAVLQQNGSATQSAFVLSQLFTRDAPVVQSECPHIPFASEHVKLSQTVRTSLTQTLSQAVLQQNGSAAQIDDTHGSEAFGRALPVEHLSWLGALAATESADPPTGNATAVTATDGLSEARPKKKLVAPLRGLPPTHTGVVNVEVISSPSVLADDNPIVPIPPVVTT